MSVDTVDGFPANLRFLLSDKAEDLFDFKLQLMDQEIAEGWRAFYALEILLKEQLPLPLINELGRTYAVERLRQDIWRKYGESASSYRSALLTQWYSEPSSLAGYRNYLDTGALDNAAAALDQTAYATMQNRIEANEGHWRFENWVNATDWYVEASSRATLTPPLRGWQLEKTVPVRDPSLPLAGDRNYWKAVHQGEWELVSDIADLPIFTKPDCNLKLMAELAPDFPYVEGLSTAKRLVFLQTGSGQWAWALMIDRTDGSTAYRYPPELILISRDHRKKLKNEHIVFSNVIRKNFVSRQDGARCLETELLFHLPRSRRLIEFYTPYVAEAQANTD